MRWTGHTVLFLVWMLSGGGAVRGPGNASVVTDAVIRTRGGGLPLWSSGEDSELPGRGPGSIPGRGTRFHMPQLRGHRQQLKILNASTKTRHSQIKLKKISHHLQKLPHGPLSCLPHRHSRKTPVCFLPLPMHFCICFKGALRGLLGRLGVAWERHGPPGLGPEDWKAGAAIL